MAAGELQGGATLTLLWCQAMLGHAERNERAAQEAACTLGSGGLRGGGGPDGTGGDIFVQRDTLLVIARGAPWLASSAAALQSVWAGPAVTGPG